MWPSTPSANRASPAPPTQAHSILCGIDTLTGTLTAGKAADLVICGIDPLAGIDALGEPANIHTAVKD
ncbi:hypothetical protein [Streptomyces sp. DSS69]|uniref:hypothetical protein n=1 Tax=Streptomyces sp. DSS69 TaxID=3113369 RepID=UPI0031F82EDB